MINLRNKIKHYKYSIELILSQLYIYIYLELIYIDNWYTYNSFQNKENIEKAWLCYIKLYNKLFLFSILKVF